MRLFWELMRTVVLSTSSWQLGLWSVSGLLHWVSAQWHPERIQLQSVCAGFSRSGDSTWADVLNRANLGMEVMHERNAHNFPLDLASGEAVPVSRSACSCELEFRSHKRCSDLHCMSA